MENNDNKNYKLLYELQKREYEELKKIVANTKAIGELQKNVMFILKELKELKEFQQLLSKHWKNEN